MGVKRVIRLLSSLPVTGFPPQASMSVVPDAAVQADVQADGWLLCAHLRAVSASQEARGILGTQALMLRFHPSTVGPEAATLGMGGMGPRPGFGVLIIVTMTARGHRERAGQGRVRRRRPPPPRPQRVPRPSHQGSAKGCPPETGVSGAWGIGQEGRAGLTAPLFPLDSTACPRPQPRPAGTSAWKGPWASRPALSSRHP